MKIDWKRAGIRQVGAAVSAHLQAHQIIATLVGGACVQIYSRNKFRSSDLDFVTEADLGRLAEVLREVGFKRQGSGRIFGREDCAFILDFVAPPISIGSEPIDQLHGVKVLKTKSGELRLLTPTDCVKDRLAAYYYWNDWQSLEQAIAVASAQHAEVDLKDIERWSTAEGHSEKYKAFAARL
jgi:hypothetical protein